MLVVIARADTAVALQKRLPFDQRIVVFRDADSLAALNTIVMGRAEVVVVDPLFAATARGAALIARVRADADLADTSLRVLTLDTDAQMLRLLQDCAEAPEATILSASNPLNWCGTRRAPRFPMVASARALVNGERCELINLSAMGVHVISSSRLRPTEEFRLALLDDQPVLRLRAVVAWSTLHILPTGPSYLAGAQFVDGDVERIAAYCERHGTYPDRTFVIPEAASAPANSSRSSSSRGKRARGHTGG